MVLPKRWRPGWHGDDVAEAPWFCVPPFRVVCSEQRRTRRAL